MKNLHLLPTDKPSRLYESLLTNKLFILENSFMDVSECNREYQNIYITSDEEIKEGDWCYNPKSKETIQAFKKYPFIFIDCKKIILTTDQELIKDGVQAIDDEFLEWFVKNPSCEEVEVKTSGGRYSYDMGGNIWIPISYKIIIPKEEPKPIHQQIIDAVGGEDKFREIAKIKPKKQSLEEAAERYERLRMGYDENYCITNDIQDLKESYYYKGRRDECIIRQERMYSEEDMKKCWEQAQESKWDNQNFDIGEQSKRNQPDFKEWFNQFKNK